MPRFGLGMLPKKLRFRDGTKPRVFPGWYGMRAMTSGQALRAFQDGFRVQRKALIRTPRIGLSSGFWNGSGVAGLLNVDKDFVLGLVNSGLFGPFYRVP